MPLRKPRAWLVNLGEQRLELDLTLTIGRSSNAVDLTLPSPRVARQHLRLTRMLSGRFFAQDLQSTNGTRLNGAPLRRAVLSSGDELEIDGVRFTFECEALPPFVPDVDFERLAGARDVEAAISVSVDAAAERGDAFALAASQGLTQPGPLAARAVERGELELEWRQGVVRAARVRTTCDFDALREAFDHPAMRYVGRLSLPSFDRFLGLHEVPLPLLEALHVGPHFVAADAQAARDELEQSPFVAAPRLATVDVQWLRDAWLVIGGERQTLDPRAQLLVGGSRVFFHQQCWRAEVTPGTNSLRHNGHPVHSAVLVPGDELSSRGVSFRFDAL
ncbi:MAG: FHA domain-containing protein [Myxococcaceae bacterium]